MTEQFLNQWFNSEPYVVAQTSGSTGKPKDILLPKQQMEASAKATNSFFGLDDTSVFHCPLSASYIAGKMMLVRALVAHGTCIMEDPSNHPAFMPCDLLAIVPTQVDHLFKHPHLAPLIKNIIIGGSALSGIRARKLVETGFHAFETYGMTETCSHVALREVATSESNFIALPGITFRLTDGSRLVINAPALGIEGLVTNDVAELTGPNQFRLLGRADNVINSGGIKLHPEVIERKIHAFAPDDFPPFYLTGIPDEKWGQALQMVVEQASAFSLTHIKSLLRHNLPPHLMPKSILILKQLPRTATGKLVRKNFAPS